MPVINTNVASIQARSNFERVQRDMDTAIARLSSGKRINTASDDAAGQAIAGRMESQIRGLNMQIRNTKDGQAMVDSMEGTLQEVTGILQRMRELAVQASSGIATAADRGYLDTEMEALVAEIDAISLNTTYNETVLFTGATFSFFADINVTGTEIITTAIQLAASSLTVSATDVSVMTVLDAQSAINDIDNAVEINKEFMINKKLFIEPTADLEN